MKEMEGLLAEACEAVSQEQLMADTAALAQWREHAGTEEERAAFDYLEERMAKIGFATQLILHDAYISLPGAARISALGRELPCITHSFGQPSPEGGLTGLVVDCGKGTREELEAASARGRIALIEGLASPWATRLANEAGAIGQIHITPDGKIQDS